MRNNPEASGEKGESVDIGEWGTMGDVEYNGPGEDNSGEIGGPEQTKTESADALLEQAKQVARKAKGEEVDDDEPAFDEKKIAEITSKKAEQDREEKKNDLRREAIEEAEDDDKMGESASATERDWQRISELVERIQSAEEALNGKGGNYRGGGVFSKLFAKFDRGDRQKSMQKHKAELFNRYGIGYDSYSPRELEHKVDVMMHNAETPGYKNHAHAINYEKIKVLTSGDNKKEITNALKSAGYKELPKGIDDENFTMHEVEQIAKVAEEIYLNLGK